METYGDRTPAIFFITSWGLLVTSAVNGNTNYEKYLKPSPAPVNQWTSIVISQTKTEDKYTFMITIGGEDLWSVVNDKASEFKNVKVFASDNYFNTFPGYIKDLRITSDGC